MQRAPIPGSGSSMVDNSDAAAGPISSFGALNLSKNSDPDGLSGPQWSYRDPRTSSTHSLVPSADDGDEDNRKRRLLVVYIHGFMGNNSSFRSFPAHVHSFLKNLLVETHVIHTKIYPRYKTYKSIDVACDNFSKWLAPHESPTTDVVLIGHSMGGLLAADVVLLPRNNPYDTSHPFRHRILGTISLDAPLLGLHPGIVVSGIASLFRPAPSPPGMSEEAQPDYLQPQGLSPDPSIYSEVSPPSGASSPALNAYPSSSTGSSSTLPPRDPYFNPPFPNDVAFVDRGWFKNILHFATKHKEENLVYAAANHIVSHLEFGACLADYPELKSRYNRLRQLEDDVDPSQPGRSTEEPRVRTPRISVDEYSDGSGRDNLQILEPMPEPEFEPELKAGLETGPEPELKPKTEPELGHELEPKVSNKPPEPHSQHEDNAPDTTNPTRTATPADDDVPPPEEELTKQDSNLPTIPSVPSPPTPPNLDALPDKESRKQALKEYKAAVKTHSQATKARDKALKDRQRALDKQERQAAKLAKKQAKLLLQQQQQQQQQHPPPSPTTAPAASDDSTTPNPPPKKPQEKEKTPSKTKPPRLRKFCLLPSQAKAGRDPAWVEVYMEGVDEVGAHCGLFLPGPHYERLVGDVGERVARWVGEEASRRVVAGGGG
ncbi:hypothetical protein CHGG_07833 [Chaetomium globosum CBS 148.51]|uniref:DUF676 domain-containing protein n=1 Tax=Chaetomium globosum (strain ATCC 6205 / CBS 148.51 / DSM 1962 / NBRC 6347 / NRRL 1970) TaxID=306901 RepID=Q2GW21_CHAGB|nr:uncharacterized protein CHGG_07833 [Chaetomium globosum CBS 148.51]EAQ86580.1 hypothetical protein CHGG_07833 [Chaetomium globosum CBS 148.51]